MFLFLLSSLLYQSEILCVCGCRLMNKQFKTLNIAVPTSNNILKDFKEGTKEDILSLETNLYQSHSKKPQNQGSGRQWIASIACSSRLPVLWHWSKPSTSRSLELNIDLLDYPLACLASTDHNPKRSESGVFRSFGHEDSGIFSPYFAS